MGKTQKANGWGDRPDNGGRRRKWELARCAVNSEPNGTSRKKYGYARKTSVLNGENPE